MKLEEQVVSLDLAKRLKELGVKQESLYVWRQGFDATKDYEYVGKHDPEMSGLTICSAFTVAELGEMLPYAFRSGRLNDHTAVCALPESLQSGFLRNSKKRKLQSQYADTEADARAKMLCYLLEQKLI